MFVSLSSDCVNGHDAFGYPCSTGGIGHTASNILGYWPWVLVALVGIFVLIGSVRIVGEKTALVIERLGRFHTVKPAGPRIKAPFIDRVVDRLSLQIVQIEEDIKVKTQDNVFVTLPVRVQYRVDPTKVKEAYYEL